MKAAIYHFTDGSRKRPKIYQDQLNKLVEFAVSQGFCVEEIFCDKSLNRCERTEFDRFLSCSDQFEVLVTKDFYHISKNTMKCMGIMQELRNRGVKIYTLENGSFSWNEAPFEAPLNVATYFCKFGSADKMKQIIPLQNDILTLFTEKKTKWNILDQYFDKSKRQNNGEQIQLMKLLENKDNYDLLLVHNLNDVHWRTANFCKIRQLLHLDIYSLQEGFLQFNEVTNN